MVDLAEYQLTVTFELSPSTSAPITRLSQLLYWLFQSPVYLATKGRWRFIILSALEILFLFEGRNARWKHCSQNNVPLVFVCCHLMRLQVAVNKTSLKVTAENQTASRHSGSELILFCCWYKAGEMEAAHADHLDSLGLIEAFASNSRAEGADGWTWRPDKVMQICSSLKSLTLLTTVSSGGEIDAVRWPHLWKVKDQISNTES